MDPFSIKIGSFYIANDLYTDKQVLLHCFMSARTIYGSSPSPSPYNTVIRVSADQYNQYPRVRRYDSVTLRAVEADCAAYRNFTEIDPDFLNPAIVYHLWYGTG